MCEINHVGVLTDVAIVIVDFDFISVAVTWLNGLDKNHRWLRFSGNATADRNIPDF